MNKDAKGYLEDLLERIDRVIEFSQDGRDAFFASKLLQDAIFRNFEVMGEIVKRLDKSFTDQHPQIPWRRIAGFRDVLIHDYEGVSLEVVWEVIERDLDTLRPSVELLLTKLDAEPPENP